MYICIYIYIYMAGNDTGRGQTDKYTVTKLREVSLDVLYAEPRTPPPAHQPSPPSALSPPSLAARYL